MYAELIVLLKEEQNKMAHLSLRRPKTNQDASYAYGYVCGVYAGYESAINSIEELIKKQDYDPDAKYPQHSEFS